MEHRFQHRHQVSLRDGLHATDHLPLGHCVDGVDMEQPGLPVVIALVHGVHPQIAWSAPWIGFAPDSPDLHPTADPSRQLRSAQSGHLHQKTTHDSFLASTDTAILLRFQNPFDELINRFPLWCGKADASTPLHKLPYLVYRQSFYVLHGDIHSPAALHPFPLLPFRLIPHWIILSVE